LLVSITHVVEAVKFPVNVSFLTQEEILMTSTRPSYNVSLSVP